MNALPRKEIVSELRADSLRVKIFANELPAGEIRFSMKLERLLSLDGSLVSDSADEANWQPCDFFDPNEFIAIASALVETHKAMLVDALSN